MIQKNGKLYDPKKKKMENYMIQKNFLSFDPKMEVIQKW